MNIIDILQQRFDRLEDGDHTIGLKAVMEHILVATKHLNRGQQSEEEESAYTDTIYRTNQAFEGSLKEAYRVLAGKDPSKETPHGIENYFQKNNILRPRVRSQLTNYRQEWRNPSTHDYRINFDEDEALFALVTVCTFAIVLADQISEKLSYLKAQTTASSAPPEDEKEVAPLQERVSNLLAVYTSQFNKDHSRRFNIRESELAGALAGFLSQTASDIVITTDAKLNDGATERADLILNTPSEKLIIELKRIKPTETNIQQAVLQVSRYISISGIKQAIIYFYYSHNTGIVSRKSIKLDELNASIMVVFTDPIPMIGH